MLRSRDCLMSGWPIEACDCVGCGRNRLAATEASAPEGLAGKADEVIRGVVDGSLSRNKVREIGDAVSRRESRDEKSDALGRAVGSSRRVFFGE